MGPLVVGVNASLSSSPSPTIDALVVVHSLTSFHFSISRLHTSHRKSKCSLSSLSSSWRCWRRSRPTATCCRVGFFILEFFSFFLGDASRTFFFFLAGGDIGGPSPFFCFWMPGLSPETGSHRILLPTERERRCRKAQTGWKVPGSHFVRSSLPRPSVSGVGESGGVREQLANDGDRGHSQPLRAPLWPYQAQRTVKLQFFHRSDVLLDRSRDGTLPNQLARVVEC